MTSRIKQLKRVISKELWNENQFHQIVKGLSFNNSKTVSKGINSEVKLPYLSSENCRVT